VQAKGYIVKPLNKPEVMNALKRLSEGDTSAHDVIYKECDGPLRLFVASRYGQRGGRFVREVVARTHTRAFLYLHEYTEDKRASLTTWYCWHARRVASEVMAELSDPRLVPYDETKHEAWAGTVAGPAEVYEDKRCSRVLREEHEALSEDGRLSVSLHDKDGLTFGETAKAMGMPVIRVRRKRELALALMKRRLQEHGIRPVEVDSTPVPIFYGWDHTEPDDNFTESVTAVLPDGPSSLVGAAAKEKDEG
jgi:DNA-directed RNA polymerase specialized sigma24 family protein